ncbi:MAG: fumarylacetoacetate hydrolase family protein [Gemmatimonadota bacterium]|nr:fumarylacetoacetate hydrolase family protein [Gemmatimonadota bacterium]
MILRPTKIVCVGRNYVAHAEELGNKIPERPLLFFKPPSTLLDDGRPIELPAASGQVEHEGELGLVIGRRLKNAGEQEAMDGVQGLVCANDVTARDLQKTDGQWARAKGFDTFCPVSSVVTPLEDLTSLEELEVKCWVNGVLRQHGFVRDMAFKIPFLVSYISKVMTLEPGDLILTGTPAGVGPLAAGDEVAVEIPGVGGVKNPVVDAIE